MFRPVFVVMASLSFSLSSVSQAQMDQGCLQRMLGQQTERLQLCRDKFHGEHRSLCETAANQVHARNVKICTSRENGAQTPPRRAG